MIRIMIVDDMPIFLQYLRGCIDWENYGFEICGEAADGRQALAQIEVCYPDIILTDITMPYMDGLELARRVAQEHPDISVILITGNNEFEYARKAVKIGVCDYIVKPFEKEELILSLLKLQDNMNRVLEIRSEKKELELRKREDALRELILGRSGSGARRRAMLEEAGIELVSEYFLVCTLHFDTERVEELESVHNWERIIVDLFRGRLAVEGMYHVFKDFENNIIILLNFRTREDMESYKTYELSDLTRLIKEQLGIGAVMGVSSYCYAMEQVREAYLNARRASGSRGAEAAGRIFDYKRLEEEQPEGYYSWESINRLTRALEEMDEAAIEATLRGELAAAGAGRGSVVLYSGFISILLTWLVNEGHNIGDIYGERFDPYGALSGVQTREEREELLLSYFHRAIDHERRLTGRASFALVESIRGYIEENYSNPELRIADISRALLVNQTYLRAAFKKETGQTLSEYITAYRMSVAKRLLRGTESKLSVIGEQVGYSDVSYFSKSFKKFYGVSPKTLRQ